MTQKRKIMTRVELAKYFEIHVQTLRKWQEQGMPVYSNPGHGYKTLFDVDAVEEWKEKRDLAAVNGEPKINWQAARAEKEKAQAELAKQTLHLRAEKLVPADEVEKAWAAEISAVRSRLLTFPQQLADRIFREKTLGDVQAVEQVIKAAVYELLTELSEPKPKRRKASRKK